MNYIIFNDMVIQVLGEMYNSYCEAYDYTAAFDTYLLNTLSFDGIFRLYNRCWNKSSYMLVGKKCLLYLEIHNRYHNCFYAKKIECSDDESKYLSKLTQTIELTGEWEVISTNEVFRIDDRNVDDISDILLTVKASYKEFYEFEEKWKLWDLYNSKRKEAEEQREAESESLVKHVLLDNNIFFIQLTDWKKIYAEEVNICVQFAGEIKFEQLGMIVSSDAKNKSICVRCEKYDLVKAYLKNQVGKISRIKVVDFGTRARLKRQREAIKRLFQEESANINIKDIFMGVFEFPKTTQCKLTMENADGLFGSNVHQKEAYIGALNSDDIYLIQGPPGTGKTTIITEIVKYVIRQNMKVLVSSETNIAVDNVLERVKYMDNIIPVRLGHEERIGQECQSFLPENISRSIIRTSKERIVDFENSGLNLDSLIKAKELEWTKQILDIEKQILKLQLQIPVAADYELLYEIIDKFENLVFEANEMHTELQKEYKDFIQLRNSQKKLQQDKNEIDAFISAVSSGVMASGFKETENANDLDLQRCKIRAGQLEVQLNDVLEKLKKNTYELKKGSYQRRLRKIEKEKNKLEKIMKPNKSFSSNLHTIKTAITDIQVLQELKKRYQQSLTVNIAEIKAEYEHKLELWNMSEDIRDEWLEIIDHGETRSTIETIYMRMTNVVFATCTGISSANHGSFATMEYDYVIIDEAAKCNMLDLLIPLVMGKKIILVGDHKQLYPMIDTDGIKDDFTEKQIAMLREHILFKLLYEERVPKEFKIMLSRQYRMHCDISEFISENFYDGNLLCEKEKNNEKSMMWIDCEKSDDHQVGSSYENQTEAEVIVDLIKKLNANYPEGTTVGIICIYKAQANKITNLLNCIQIPNIEVECSTVDAFQGKEKHTIIFNMVRSNKVTSFMVDENRVNVAVSRAQEFLYVVGNVEIVKTRKSGILGKLYEYIKQHGEIRNSRYVKM